MGRLPYYFQNSDTAMEFRNTLQLQRAFRLADDLSMMQN
jgi:hypothetical protein